MLTRIATAAAHIPGPIVPPGAMIAPVVGATAAIAPAQAAVFDAMKALSQEVYGVAPDVYSRSPGERRERRRGTNARACRVGIPLPPFCASASPSTPALHPPSIQK